MAGSSLSLSSVLTTLSNKLLVPHSNELTRPAAVSLCNPIACSRETNVNDGSNCKRRLLLLGIGGLTSNLFPASPLFAEEVPKNYRAFVDSEDGYSYYYPSDWIDFDFLGHDSAFKDRYRQLQNVRVRFIPTDKKDIHDLGPMEERTVDGKNYYTVEFALTSPNFACNSFATIAIGNGRYYTLIVGANERRWKKFRNMLKVIADSFKMLDI
ncbi:photosynthetic NDH subunit of lumenal location 1, chloroplastic isoform X2 [Tripterygium wilfordii]|uniref:photosynthetic NDH subunit of lumenal location 1, chloroplastic isoform X2 n=1 Tax=Tripterygium wilfordii TaxID=458696 RepID=UPI0018F81AE5|nr:photosynthetic NDH subunit of lumenal location 1, chloroplastic isoform X2 [Tripterygium wilfordii]